MIEIESDHVCIEDRTKEEFNGQRVTHPEDKQKNVAIYVLRLDVIGVHEGMSGLLGGPRPKYKFASVSRSRSDSRLSLAQLLIVAFLLTVMSRSEHSHLLLYIN